MTRQATDWQKIFLNHTSDKGLEHIIQNIYSGPEYIMNSYKSIRTTNNPI